MTPAMSLLRPRASRQRREPGPGPLDVRAIRSHFSFPEAGRIVTNNAASTQPPRELVALYRSLAPGYENVRALADASGYPQPGGERRSYLLVDAAQLVPGSFVDVQALNVDYLAFSFHKLLAPFGVGVLYAKEHLLRSSLPFLYGGDMIAEGRVFPDRVEYNALPWKYAAGTPNILGAIISAQALRILLDLALTPDRPSYFGTARPLGRAAVKAAMDRISGWNKSLTARALDGLGSIPALTIYGRRLSDQADGTLVPVPFHRPGYRGVAVFAT